MAVEIEYFGVPPAEYKEVESRFRYIASSNQTTFNGAYTVGFVDVFLNGAKLDPITEFTATNGVNVVLSFACAGGEIIEIISRRQLAISDIYSRQQVDNLVANYYGITTGTGDALVLATVPSFSTFSDGMQIKVRTHAANTSTTPTININGTGAKQILTYNQQVCTGGDWAANSEITLRYNQALDKYILVEGSLTAPLPSLTDNTDKFATVKFLRSLMGNFAANGVALTANKTFSISEAGSIHSLEAVGLTINLPLASSVPAGTTFLIRKRNGSVGTANVYHNSTLIRTIRAEETSLMLFISDGGSGYVQNDIPEGPPQLNLSSTGYQRFHTGLIMQWGYGTAGPSGSSVINTFPITFPNACFTVNAVHIGLDSSVNIILDSNIGLSKTQFGARSSFVSGNVAIMYVATGY